MKNRVLQGGAFKKVTTLACRRRLLPSPPAIAGEAEDEPEPDEPKKTPRTHWDMLLERRKVDELEVLLNERLEALRSGEVYRERVSG